MATAFRAVELLSGQLSIPGQKYCLAWLRKQLVGVLTSQPFDDLGERGSLWIGRPKPSGQMPSENSVFSDQVLVLQQDLLIHIPVAKANSGAIVCLHGKPTIIASFHSQHVRVFDPTGWNNGERQMKQLPLYSRLPRAKIQKSDQK